MEALDESNVPVKALEFLNKNGVINPSLVTPIARLLVPTNKSQFRLFDDPDRANSNDYVMNAAKNTI